MWVYNKEIPFMSYYYSLNLMTWGYFPESYTKRNWKHLKTTGLENRQTLILSWFCRILSPTVLSLSDLSFYFKLRLINRYQKSADLWYFKSRDIENKAFELNRIEILKYSQFAQKTGTLSAKAEKWGMCSHNTCTAIFG